MVTLLDYWPFVRGTTNGSYHRSISRTNSQWFRALIRSLLPAWSNLWNKHLSGRSNETRWRPYDVSPTLYNSAKWCTMARPLHYLRRRYISWWIHPGFQSSWRCVAVRSSCPCDHQGTHTRWWSEVQGHFPTTTRNDRRLPQNDSISESKEYSQTSVAPQ